MRNLYYLILFVCFSTFSLIAQDIAVTGQVTDSETNKPLGFVTVSVKVGEDLRGAQADSIGNYTINVPPGNHTIVFSYIGYKAKELNEVFSAGEARTINVTLSEEQELLETVVVTGTKFEQKLGEQTVSLEVVKPTLVESNNNTAIDQTVEKVPGVDVVDGQANIRGGSGYSYGAGSRVMLLMDDLPVLTADAGFPNWDFLPIENLSQIEIIKGASSALYGSSAMNGIINIRTAYPKSKPETRFTFFSGIYQNPSKNKFTYYLDNEGERIVDTLGLLVKNANDLPSDVTVADTVEAKKSWWNNQFPFESGASFAHCQKFGNLDLVAGGYFFMQDSWRQQQYGRRGRLNLNLRYRVPSVPGLSIGLNTNGMLNTSASFLIWNGANEGAYQLWEVTPQINNVGKKLTLDPFVEYFTENGMRHKLLGRYYKNDNANDTNQSTNSDFFYGEYQFQKRFEPINFTITAGITSSLALSTAELYAGSQFRASNYAGYAQLDKKFFDRLNLSLGFRYELNEIGPKEEGMVINGIEVKKESEGKPVVRAGINYQPAEYTFIRASYGQAYRFPTIAEKFISTELGEILVADIVPAYIGIYPNPNLKSETGWSAELGIKQGLKLGEWSGFIDISGFINEYQDMMEFTFGVPQALLPILCNVTEGEFCLDTTLVVIPSRDDGKIPAGFQSINIGNTRIFGGDLSIAGQDKLFCLPVDLLAGYTYILPKFQVFDDVQDQLSSADRNILKYRFQHTVKFDAEVQIKKFAIGGALRYYSRMEAIDEAFNQFLPGIKEFRQEHDGGTTVIDARIIYNVTDNSSVSFIVKNLTNLEYALRPALIDAPRNFTIKYSHNLGSD